MHDCTVAQWGQNCSWRELNKTTGDGFERPSVPVTGSGTSYRHWILFYPEMFSGFRSDSQSSWKLALLAPKLALRRSVGVDIPSRRSRADDGSALIGMTEGKSLKRNLMEETKSRKRDDRLVHAAFSWREYHDYQHQTLTHIVFVAFHYCIVVVIILYQQQITKFNEEKSLLCSMNFPAERVRCLLMWSSDVICI